MFHLWPSSQDSSAKSCWGQASGKRSVFLAGAFKSSKTQKLGFSTELTCEGITSLSRRREDLTATCRSQPPPSLLREGILPQLLMIADFRNLHGQLQTVARILTGAEQTTVQIHAGVFIAAPSRLCHSLHVSVAGAAVVGGRLTGGREEQNQVVEVAEEAAQDHFSTVNCGRNRTFRSLRRD